MLADCLRREPLGADRAVLDACTGSGVLAITAALAGAGDVTAIDVSRRAVLTVRINARLNGVRVRALRGDLLEPVAGRRFDAIASNPPYVPSADDELPRRGARRAWDAGTSGRTLLDRLCEQAPAHLRPGGALLVTHSDLLGVERTVELMERGGLEVDVPSRRRGPLGPLMTQRREMLEQRGMLAPGQREEEIVVVRGRAPR
jgi:release factor glutamine methyltransferase